MNNLRFPGQYYDSETGMHYNHQRYYDPSSGRYLRPDPLNLGSINVSVPNIFSNYDIFGHSSYDLFKNVFLGSVNLTGSDLLSK